MSASRRRVLPTMVGGVALIVVLLPSAQLRFLATAAWEQELVRFLAFFTIPVTWLWPWAAAVGDATATRMRRWVGAMSVTVAGYLFTAASIFLVSALCLAAGCALGMGVERAHAASDQLRRRVEDAG